MAAPTNTFSRYSFTKGSDAREELARMIELSSPTETPFMSMIGRGKKPGNTKIEWEEDRLRPAAANAHIEGDEFSADAQRSPARYHTYTQISREDIVVSGTAQALNTVDGRKLLAKYVSKAGAALKRDMEHDLTSRQLSAEGAAGTARKSAGAVGWCIYNYVLGSGGTPVGPALGTSTTEDGVAIQSGTPETAPTVGTTSRGLKMTHFRKMIRDVYEGGGMATTALMVPEVKERFSNFMYSSSSVSAEQQQDQGPSGQGKKGRTVGSTAQAAVGFYQSNFGRIILVPNRNQDIPASGKSDVLIITPNKWELCFLRRFHVDTMGRTGDSHKRVLVVEYALKCISTWAHAAIIGVNNSTAVSE